MRNFIIIVLALLPLTSAWPQPVNIGSTAPNWSLQTKAGETIDYYQDSDNKVSVILFWATWCPYCATLMPHLEVIYRKYRNKGLNFYAIDIYEDGKLDPVEYFENKEYTYTLLLAGDLVAEDYGVKGTPGLYVVDKDKKIIYKRPGGVSDVLVKQNVDLRIKQAIAK
jgi:cytochrome c biogenesis protein CcmG, thiol:disulfide interchange protein DsbE